MTDAQPTNTLYTIALDTIDGEEVFWLHIPGAGQWGKPTDKQPAATFKTQFAAKVEARLLGVEPWARIIPQPAA